MVVNSDFHQTLIFLDHLISQRLFAIERKFGSEASELKPFGVSPEEVKVHLRAGENLDSASKEIWASEQSLPGLEILGKIFHLTDFEKKALLVILAPEIDPKYERIYVYLQDDLTRKYPMIALVSFLLLENDSERWQIFPYFQPQAPPLKFRLIRFVDAPPETSFLFRPLKLEESVRDFILGFYSLENRLKSFCGITPLLERKNTPSEAKNLIQAQ